MDSGRTPAKRSLKHKCWPFGITTHFRDFKKSVLIFKKDPPISFCSDLWMRYLYKISSTAFEKYHALHSLDLKIVIDTSWLSQVFPCLKPDWYGDIKTFSLKNWYISLYIRRLNVFLKIGRSEAGREFLTFCLPSRLWIGTTLAVFHLVWKIPNSIQKKAIKYNGLLIVLPQVCNRWILIWSCLCALLGFNFLIILKTSC